MRRGVQPCGTIIVEHPALGRFRADNVRDNLQAVQAAARAWKAQWSAIAKECRFTKGGDEGADLDGNG